MANYTIYTQKCYDNLPPCDFYTILKNDGKAYIVTNYSINEDTVFTFETDIKFNNYDGRQLMGFSSNKGCYFGKSIHHHMEFGNVEGRNTVHVDDFVNLYYDWSIAGSYVVYDNETLSYGVTSLTHTDNKIVLFGLLTEGELEYNCNLSLQTVVVKEANDLLHYNTVMELVPCKLNKNTNKTWDGEIHLSGECGMWDMVNNVFYGNVNAEGEFTVE